MANLDNLAYPYANALFELALDAGNTESWLTYLKQLSNLIHDEEFTKIIHDPKVNNEQLVLCILDILNSSDSGLKRLVELLLCNNRLLAVNAIYQQFEKLLAQKQNTAKAIIQSAFAVSNKEKEELEVKLSNKFGKKAITTIEVVPELIGGIKILIDDAIIDASVRGSLNQLATKII